RPNSDRRVADRCVDNHAVGRYGFLRSGRDRRRDDRRHGERRGGQNAPDDAPERDVDMSDEDLSTEPERLKAENERLKAQHGRSVSLKVSEKGGVSVYGLGRFPVTLYKEQWTKLLAMSDEIRAFISEHAGDLKTRSGS